MENTNQKFGNVVAALQALVETGNFVIDLQKNVHSTSYRTGSLEQALQKQVIEETVHHLGEEDEQPQEPTRRIKIQIIGLDNETTILRKIEIAQAMFDGTLEEVLPSEELKNSDRLLDCLDGHFGAGPELDRQFLESKKQAEIAAEEKDNNPSDEVSEETVQDEVEQQDLPQTPYGQGEQPTDEENQETTTN
jgi:hypothetical protein